MLKVLFTGGGGAGNEALWRLLSDKYALHFGDPDPTAIDPSIPADRRHRLPWASDQRFIEQIASACRQLHIDVLIPGVDEELLMLAKNISSLAPTRLLLPNAEYVETMLDKLLMVRMLESKMIEVPHSRTLADNLHGLLMPCIAKPRKGRGSRGVRTLLDQSDLTEFVAAMAGKAETILLQDKIPGIEYTVQMCSTERGILRAMVPVRVAIKRGITTRAETDANPLVMEACRRIHEALPAAGCYNIQLMLTKEGRVLPFEINPRISTTFCLAVAAGIDPISIFFESGSTTDTMPFKSGVQLRRYWKNCFYHVNLL